MVSTIAATEKKATLRKKIKELQGALLTESSIESMSTRIAKRFFSLQEFSDARNVLIYLSTKNEVQTGIIINKLFETGKRVFVPIVDENNNDLLVSELPGLDIKLEKGVYGIRVPGEKDREIVSPDIIDFAIVPGLAFSRDGSRLGRGKGYYDRLLARFPANAKKVGAAFEFQILDFIPRCQHDIGMDMVLTENETFNC